MRGQHAAPLTAFVAVAALCATIVAQGWSVAVVPSVAGPAEPSPQGSVVAPGVDPLPALGPGLSSVRVPGRVHLAPLPLPDVEPSAPRPGPAVVPVPDYFTADPRAGLTQAPTDDPRPLLVLPGLLGLISSPPRAGEDVRSGASAPSAPPASPTPAPPSSTTSGTPSTPGPSSPPSEAADPTPTPSAPSTPGGSSAPGADTSGAATGPTSGSGGSNDASAPASDG